MGISARKFDRAIRVTTGRCSQVTNCIRKSVIVSAGAMFGPGSEQVREDFSNERFKGGSGGAKQTYIDLY